MRRKAMRTVSDTRQQLAVILVRQLRLPPETAFSDGDLLEDAGLDSLGMLAFIASLERDFEISISDRDYESLQTFGDAVALIERLTR
jgi:acyl carrier protein